MQETIAAISTAAGEGGIGIVRISGSDALDILDKIFITEAPVVSRKLTYGYIVDPKTGERIDEVLSVYMKAPKTYTAEDVVEINCHGSIVSLNRILSLVLRSGATLAEPGEFTKRAFLNGRLDLSQAEAVIDLIKAKTELTFDVALNQLEGIYSDNIKSIRKKMVDILVNIAVNIDYPDEDIEELTYKNLNNNLNEIKDEIQKLVNTSDTGRMIRDGLKVTIVGKPNVGKSSLLNALLKEKRAIVTDIPGTTRDIIEENISLRGIPIIITDTAGIRQTEDIIEKIGIEKSKESFNSADLVILILDGSKDLEESDYEIIKHIGNRKVVVIKNKKDICEKVQDEEIENNIKNSIIIKTSIKENIGLDKLVDTIEELVYNGKVFNDKSAVVTNVRHKILLEEAMEVISDALDMVKINEALEVIEIDVNRAYEALGEIIGESVKENIIDEVFARFCLGK